MSEEYERDFDIHMIAEQVSKGSARHAPQHSNGANGAEAQITPCVNAPACKFEGTTVCRQCVNESEFFPA